MKYLNVVLSVILSISIIFIFMVIIYFGYGKGSEYNKTFSYFLNVVFGCFIGNYARIKTEKFYNWFKSNIKN